MLKALFRRTKHHQVVREKQTAVPAASNSDTLVHSSVCVRLSIYPIHINYEEEW